jgi:hypothetical protein
MNGVAYFADVLLTIVAMTRLDACLYAELMKLGPGSISNSYAPMSTLAARLETTHANSCSVRSFASDESCVRGRLDDRSLDLSIAR